MLCLVLAPCNPAESGVARRQFCEDDYRRVYLAARQAIHDVGARIIHSDERSGSVVGRIEADIYGRVIEISAWVNRDGDARPGTSEPMWVQVRANIRKVKKPDEEQRAQLEAIEDQVFGLISQRAACGPPS
jgi:hypothetical protein